MRITRSSSVKACPSVLSCPLVLPSSLFHVYYSCLSMYLFKGLSLLHLLSVLGSVLDSVLDSYILISCNVLRNIEAGILVLGGEEQVMKIPIVILPLFPFLSQETLLSSR